jgi:hypothetical protein
LSHVKERKSIFVGFNCLDCTNSYQSLVHECLGLGGNRVSLPSGEGEGAVATLFDLDSEHDSFWREQRGASWGLIGPAIKRYRESWQSESEAVLKLQVRILKRKAKVLVKQNKKKKNSNQTKREKKVEGSESQQQMLAKVGCS